MNKILVNNNQLIGSAKGIIRYYYSIEPHLAKKFVLEMLFSEQEKNGIKKKLREQFVSLRNRSYDILWSPSQSGPVLGKNHVVTVHDLIPLHPESGISNSYKLFYKNNVGLLLRKANHVVCISASVADMVQIFFGTKSSKISIIRNGYDFFDNKFNAETATSDSDYILFVGTVSVHKNLSRLIEAFKLFRAINKRKIHLVVAGNMPSTKSLGDTRMDLDSMKSEGIVFYNNPSDEMLHTLYKGCSGLAMPSLTEGFGLPITEALSYGKPVICSDISVFRELFGGMIRSYFNPYDIKSIVDSIKILSETDAVLTKNEIAAYSEKINWTWERAANEYSKLFNQLL